MRGLPFEVAKSASVHLNELGALPNDRELLVPRAISLKTGFYGSEVEVSGIELMADDVKALTLVWLMPNEADPYVALLTAKSAV